MQILNRIAQIYSYAYFSSYVLNIFRRSFYSFFFFIFHSFFKCLGVHIFYGKIVQTKPIQKKQKCNKTFEMQCEKLYYIGLLNGNVIQKIFCPFAFSHFGRNGTFAKRPHLFTLLCWALVWHLSIVHVWKKNSLN